MPYELDYKKVHNTLKSETLENHYGCTKGKIPNLLGEYEYESTREEWDYIVDKILIKNNQYLVIQNNTNAALEPRVTIFTKDNLGLDITIDPEPQPSKNYTYIRIDANSRKIIEIPTNISVVQNGEKIPYRIQLRFYDIRNSDDNITINQVSVWETESDILGYEEDNLIIRTERPEEITKVKINTLNWNIINNYLNSIDFNLNSKTNDGHAEIEFTFPEDTQQVLSMLQTNNFNLVVVPVRAKTGQPLKSITNMRNTKQTDLYDDQYRKVSLYLEPIKLHIQSSAIETQSTTVTFTFNVPSSFPIALSNFKDVKSRRGYTTYGLLSNNLFNASWALAVCRGCGYDEGRDGGITKIKLALGLQLNKIESENPHSGCSLSYFRILGDDNDIITLNRLALTRNDNQNCIIYLTPLNE